MAPERRAPNDPFAHTLRSTRDRGESAATRARPEAAAELNDSSDRPSGEPIEVGAATAASRDEGARGSNEGSLGSEARSRSTGSGEEPGSSAVVDDQGTAGDGIGDSSTAEVPPTVDATVQGVTTDGAAAVGTAPVVASGTDDSITGSTPTGSANPGGEILAATPASSADTGVSPGTPPSPGAADDPDGPVGDGAMRRDTPHGAHRVDAARGEDRLPEQTARVTATDPRPVPDERAAPVDRPSEATADRTRPVVAAPAASTESDGSGRDATGERGRERGDGPRSAPPPAAVARAESINASLRGEAGPVSAGPAPTSPGASGLDSLLAGSQTSRGDGAAGEPNPRSAAPVLRGVSALVSQRGGTMTIRLDPPALGQVRIAITMQGGMVSAELLAGESRAQSLLERHLGQLRATLERHGLTVERLAVDRLGPDRAALERVPLDTGRPAREPGAPTTGGHASRSDGAASRHDAADGQSRGRHDADHGTPERRQRDARQFEDALAATDDGPGMETTR